MLRRPPLVVLLLISSGIVARAHAAVDPGKKCSATKLTATAKALQCQAKEQNQLLLGKPGDLAKCDAKLSAGFSNAEDKASGACPTTGDATAVGALVSGVEASVLTTLMASSASTPSQTACVVAKNRSTAKYTYCQAVVFSKRMFTLPTRVRCSDALAKSFAAQEAKGGCLTLGDAGAIPDLVNPAASYLRDANLSHLGLKYAFLFRADLTDASLFLSSLSGANLSEAHLSGASLAGAYMRSPPVNLSGADLTGADLFGAAMYAINLSGANLSSANLAGTQLTFADLSGADLSSANLSSAYLDGAFLTDANLTGVTWGATTCPDGTRSDLNGSSPESCCANMNGNVPASCSP